MLLTSARICCGLLWPLLAVLNGLWCVSCGTGGAELSPPVLVDRPGDLPVAQSDVAWEATPVEDATILPEWIELAHGVRIDPASSTVEFPATISLEDGWLEQIVCSPGTREYESILVTKVPASSLHASMLAAGFRPGRPGRWVSANRMEPPEGSVIDVLVRGDAEAVPIERWVRSERGRTLQGPWIFGGSIMGAPGSVPEGVSLYEADRSGSIIGLVTFGDETIGLSRIIHHEADTAPEEWRVATDAVPSVGTPVTVILRPHRVRG